MKNCHWFDDVDPTTVGMFKRFQGFGKTYGLNVLPFRITSTVNRTSAPF